MTIGTIALMRETGASHRQIDYWCSADVISPVGNPNPGSGNHREFDKDIVGRITLLVKVSKAFGHGLRGNTLKKIYDAYDEGYVDLGDGFIFMWPDEKNSDTERVRTHNDALDLLGDE